MLNESISTKTLQTKKLSAKEKHWEPDLWDTGRSKASHSSYKQHFKKRPMLHGSDAFFFFSLFFFSAGPEFKALQFEQPPKLTIISIFIYSRH